MVFVGKMFEEHLWKSDILSKDAGLTTWFLHRWNFGQKWVKVVVLYSQRHKILDFEFSIIPKYPFAILPSMFVFV